MDYEGAKNFIIKKLSEGLRPELQYHDLNHTLDVLESAERLAILEHVNGHDLTLLKTAAVYHDAGMLIRYENHEEAASLITYRYLPDFGYSPADIHTINHMILTTKLPQNAHTKLEKILCDADLDYLGRDDFYMISHRLLYEWTKLNVNKMTLREWYKLQLDFLGHHQYYTPSANALRQQKKNIHLTEVRELFKNSVPEE